METTNIYVLIDPITNIVRYVGKANNVTQRYRAHLNRARKHQIHKKNWIEQLKREGLKPIIEVIDIVPIGDWIFWETYWISQMRAWGFDLINYTNGGDGCTFANQTSFKKGQGGKQVVGYNKDGVKCYNFDSIRQGETAIKTHSMWGVLKGNRKTCKGLAWFYYEHIKNLSELELINLIKQRFTTISVVNSGSFKKGNISLRRQKVDMYSLEDEYLKTFESIGDAAKEVCVTNGSIQFACTKSKKGVCKNYKWKYSK
jgi:hypothetical protein